MLDAQEYLYLAINASQNNEHHAAMEHLHHALEKEPDNAQAIFMLAAEHAELGLIERAVEGMEKAISIDPSIEMASFQLAMLYVSSGKNNRAVELWGRLSKESEIESIKRFSEAMLLLVDEQVSQAIELVKEGIALNEDNPALNTMMKNIVSRTESGNEDASPETITEDVDQSPVYLGAYQNSTLSDDK